MLPAFDSATPPTTVQATAARAAGIHVWSGYLATRLWGLRDVPNPFALAHIWTQADFDTARLAGATPLAFASGWDDPLACKALASAWNVQLCLDVEGGIRPDGPWVQPWLDASGAGLYGVSGVHVGRRAAFHIAAWYVIIDPKATWPPSWPRPAAPCGWQWQNTHTELGASVDRSWLDDWFGGNMAQWQIEAVGTDQTVLEAISDITEVTDSAGKKSVHFVGIGTDKHPYHFWQDV